MPAGLPGVPHGTVPTVKASVDGSGPAGALVKRAYLRPLIPAVIVGLPLVVVGLGDLLILGEIDFASLIEIGVGVLAIGVLRTAWWAVTVATAVVGACGAGITYGRLLGPTRTVPWDGVIALRLRRGMNRPEWRFDPAFTEIEVDLADGKTMALGKYLWISQTGSEHLAEFSQQCLGRGVELRVT